MFFLTHCCFLSLFFFVRGARFVLGSDPLVTQVWDVGAIDPLPPSLHIHVPGSRQHEETYVPSCFSCGHRWSANLNSALSLLQCAARGVPGSVRFVRQRTNTVWEVAWGRNPQLHAVSQGARGCGEGAHHPDSAAVDSFLLRRFDLAW